MRINAIISDSLYQQIESYFLIEDNDNEDEKVYGFHASFPDVLVFNTKDYCNALVDTYTFGKDNQTLLIDKNLFSNAEFLLILYRFKNFNPGTEVFAFLKENDNPVLINEIISNNLANVCFTLDEFEEAYMNNVDINKQHIINISKKDYKNFQNG